jgi:hypothetical protein
MMPRHSFRLPVNTLYYTPSIKITVGDVTVSVDTTDVKFPNDIEVTIGGVTISVVSTDVKFPNAIEIAVGGETVSVDTTDVKFPNDITPEKLFKLIIDKLLKNNFDLVRREIFGQTGNQYSIGIKCKAILHAIGRMVFISKPTPQSLREMIEYLLKVILDKLSKILDREPPCSMTTQDRDMTILARAYFRIQDRPEIGDYKFGLTRDEKQNIIGNLANLFPKIHRCYYSALQCMKKKHAPIYIPSC